MDSVVQLIRNAMCVCKDLELFRHTFLWDVSIPRRYYELSKPYNQTFPLECFISITQAYVVYSGVPAGINMMITNYQKYQRIQQYLLPITQKLIQQQQQQKDNNNNIVALSFLNISLYNDGIQCIRQMFVGLNIFFIAISFVWLAGNSWHVTETDLIGGIQGLINALTVMNICLTPLLYYMYLDGINHLRNASNIQKLSRQLQDVLDNNKSNNAVVDINNHDTLRLLISATTSGSNDSVFFWNTSNSIATASAKTIIMDDEEKLMIAEQQKIQNILYQHRIMKDNNKNAKDNTNNDQYQEVLHDTIYHLSDMAPVITIYGYRELIYLLLNFIAWYGYGLCIFAYYYSNETTKPSYIRSLFLYMNSKDADFYGNLAGDCMWTLEPIVALLSPYYIQYIEKQHSNTKRKKDNTVKSNSNDKAKTE